MVAKSVVNIVAQKDEKGNMVASNSIVLTPAVKFGGGSIKWLPDKYKEK